MTPPWHVCVRLPREARASVKLPSVRIEPGLAKGATAVEPIQEYYVVFWRQPLVTESELAPSAGVTQESVMWASSEQYVRDADDVHDVISWAEAEGRRRSAMYTLYAVTSAADREVLVWLAGVDPTTNGPNFELRRPRGVDPVGGTPEEVYGVGWGSDSA
jgi:hypothetical protein